MSLCDCRGIFANGKEVTRRRSGAASRGSDEAIHKNDRQACRRINQRFLKQKKNRHSIQTVNIRMSDRFFTFIYFLSGPYLWLQNRSSRRKMGSGSVLFCFLYGFIFLYRFISPDLLFFLWRFMFLFFGFLFRRKLRPN